MAKTTEATLRWTGGTTFEAEAANGATLQVDMPIELDGTGNGFHPMELLLYALGGCMGVTLAQIVARQRLALDAYTVTLRGERAEQPPTRYTHIVVEHRFRGERLHRANLERLVNMVEERYCAVAATLPHGLAEHIVVIEESDG